MTYSVVGMGAIGGFYGGRLAKAGRTVRQLIYDQMMEVIGAANALGVEALTADLADKMMQMTDEMVPYSPSMKLDYDFHRPMEIEYLYTRPIAEAKRVSFEMPKLAMLEAELKFIQEREQR